VTLANLRNLHHSPKHFPSFPPGYKFSGFDKVRHGAFILSKGGPIVKKITIPRVSPKKIKPKKFQVVKNKNDLFYLFPTPFFSRALVAILFLLTFLQSKFGVPRNRSSFPETCRIYF
jgi:hypothetical protein